MYIEELREGEEDEVKRVGEEEEKAFSCGENSVLVSGGSIIVLNAKRVLIGVGARALFYPTLIYNVLRNKIEAEFRWWDRIDQFILLGAVPFPTDVPRLKELGVRGVITLNEPYETLVPSSLYESYGIDHLVIPTRDYCFAPSIGAISRAVDFIHGNALLGKTTYVHCKAGRGRSTTIVICYLVWHKNMTPEAAYDYVRSIRPRVLLASSQLKAVQEYYHLKVKKHHGLDHNLTTLVPKCLKPAQQDLMLFDDGSVVLVTRADLEGYDDSKAGKGVPAGSEIWADLSMVYRVKVAGQAALTRISCLWLRCQADEKISRGELLKNGGCISLDIHVY